MPKRLRLNSSTQFYGLPDFCGADSAQTTETNPPQTGSAGTGTQPPQQTGGPAGTQQTQGTENQYENPEAKIKALTEEKDRHWQSAEAMKAENQKLKEFKEEVERKGLSETEALKRDLEGRDAKITVLTEVNKTLSIQMAFLKNGTYEWVDGDAALKLVELPTDIKVSDTGEVEDQKALNQAIKNLAEKSPWLLKNKTTTEASKVAETTGNPPATTGQSAKTETEEQKRKGLENLYPSLRIHK